MATRAQMIKTADALLRNAASNQPLARLRYRGQRPAWNWLAKRDAHAAAALWMVARERLPLEAANDNEPSLTQVDRRPSGKPRGKNPDPRSLDAYLALPAAQPRLGDAEPEPAVTGRWDGESRGLAIKPQRDVFEHHPDCRHGFFAPAIAEGAIFLGAIGGLGTPKAGKRRGDVRRADEGTVIAPPAEVDTVIEVMLSGGNVSDVGKALGANRGYADRRGGAALLSAGKWAVRALAA